MKAKDVLGRRGEQLATDFLVAQGYTILDRNWRCARGEIDVVAERGGVTVFVEVKTRSGLRYGHPFEAITIAKLARLRRLSQSWCEEARARQRHVGADGSRIDAIRTDAIRTDAIRTDAIRTDAIRTDAIRTDAIRIGAIRTDAVRIGAIRIDVIGVVAPPREPVVIEHLVGIF